MNEIFKKYMKNYIKLSREEQDELFKRWQQGDKEAGDKLLHAFFPLILKCFSLFHKRVPKHLREDYREELVTIFFITAKYYNPERGMFSTLYVNSAKNLTHIFRDRFDTDEKKKKKYRKYVKEKQREEIKKKRRAATFRFLLDDDIKAEIEKAVNRLSVLKKKVVCMYFGLLGEKQVDNLTEIAKMLNVGYGTVKRGFHEALNEIRNYLEQFIGEKKDDTTTETTNPSSSE